MLNTYILPNLPHPLYRLAYPQKGLMPGSPGSHTPTTASLSSSSSASVSSSVSGLTQPSLAYTPSTVTGAQSQGNNRKGSFQANLNPDKALQQLIDYGTTIKSLIGPDPPPTLDEGSLICLSYYVRNGCWSNCKRANTHNRVLTSTEKAKLESYIQHQA
jgi:hypothetical protein